MLTLKEIQSEIEKRAALIGAIGNHSLPTYGESADFARPHIEVSVHGYHFVVVERGQELSRVTTQSLDELLYEVFDAVTFTLACDYELAHRVESTDSRRVLFQRQVELLMQLSSSWGDRKAAEISQILYAHPFDDY